MDSSNDIFIPERARSFDQTESIVIIDKANQTLTSLNEAENM